MTLTPGPASLGAEAPDDVVSAGERTASRSVSPEALALAFRSVKDPVLIVRRSDATVIGSNPAANRFFGCFPEHLAGADLFSLCPGNFRTALAGTLRSGAITQRLHARVLDHAGDVIEADLDIVRLAADCSAITVLPIRADDTAELLRQLQERYSELVDNATDIIYTQDLQANFLSLNNAAYRMTGYSREEARSMSMMDIVAPEYWDKARTSLERKLKGLPFENPYELELLARDGRRIPVEVATRLIHKDGKPVGVHGIARDVSARKAAEKALRESEAKFRAVSETAPCAIFIYQGSNFRYANPGSVAVTGYSREDLLNRQIWDVVHPDFKALVQDRSTARLAGDDTAARYELKIVARNGEERWLDFSTRTVEYEGSGAVLGIGFDVTERRRAEQQIRVQQLYLQQLFDNAPEAIVLIDRTNKVIRINSEFTRLFGYTVEESLGKSIDNLVVPGDKLQEAAWIDQNRLEKLVIETTRRRKDGTLLDVSLLVAPVRMNGGELAAYVIYRDITSQKRADQRLRESEEHFRMLIENSSDVISVIGLDGTLKYESPSVETVLGYRPEEMVGRSGFDFVHPDDHESAIAGVADAMSEEPSSLPIELRYRRKDGEYRDFEVTSSKLFEDGRLIGLVVNNRDITERRRAEKAIVESEAKFRAVAETASSAIYIHNGERFLYVNRASELISGYSRDELLAMHPMDIIHPESREFVMERAKARLSGKDVAARYEFKILTRHGEIRWLDFSAGLIQFEGGTAMLATAFDITDRKRAEHLQSAMYRITDRASSVSDLDELFAAIHRIVGELMYAGNFYIALLDDGDEQIRFAYFVDEEDEQPASRPRGRTLTDYVLRSGQTLFATPEKFQALMAAGEVDLVGPNSVDWLGVPLKSGRRTFGVIAVQSYHDEIRFSERDRDVLVFVAQHVAAAIERKRQEDELRQSEARYRSLFESAVYGIYRSSLDGRFLDVNPALVAMLGYGTAEELLVLSLANDIYVDPQERSRLIREHVVERSQNAEVTWKRKDGRHIQVRLSGRVLRNAINDVVGFEMIVEDVTERRNLEDQLRQAQKMEAIGRLAGGVAHDFNNLLTVIKGYSELMLDAIPAGGALRGEAEEVKKAADRAAGLTRQLLAFSRQQVLAPKVIDLNSVITNMDKLLRRLLSESVRLHTNLDPALGRVKADPGQIEQVIMNLAVNARDAMPNGGRLNIETANLALTELQATEQGNIKAGQYVALSVTDTGTGMDEATRTRIFEPFFTTKETGKGTGLGLSTVYGIVRQSGGQVAVFSEVGRGATFRVFLPRVDGATEIALARPEQQTRSSAHETVLLVEDEDGVRALVREVLHRHGYHVLEARHGGEALLLCERHAGNIDLLLTDMVLEHMSGRQLAEKLQPLRPKMRVIYMSGYTDDVSVQQAAANNGIHFLQKPFTNDSLAAKVREVLDAKIDAKLA